MDAYQAQILFPFVLLSDPLVQYSLLVTPILHHPSDICPIRSDSTTQSLSQSIMPCDMAACGLSYVLNLIVAPQTPVCYRTVLHSRYI